MSGEAEYHARRVDQMLTTAKTKADLVRLVRGARRRRHLRSRRNLILSTSLFAESHH